MNTPQSSEGADSFLKPAERPRWREVAPDIWSLAGWSHNVSQEAIAASLQDQPPWIEPSLLYDPRGSRLFEKITRLPEYYLTRTEESILTRYAEAIIETASASHIVELGAGFSVKTRTLLEEQLRQQERAGFTPIDVSLTALRASRDAYQAALPKLRFRGLHGDSQAALAAVSNEKPRLVPFLGSSIGNYSGREMLDFWRNLKSSMRPGDFLLLGVDRVKDPALIDAAYNDSRGVTETFIRNALQHLNAQLGADFNSRDFEYRARYRSSRQRVELELITRRPVVARCRTPATTIEWKTGTSLLVEVSRKFEVEPLVRQADCFGLNCRARFEDKRQWFSLLLFECQAQPDHS